MVKIVLHKLPTPYKVKTELKLSIHTVPRLPNPGCGGGGAVLYSQRAPGALATGCYIIVR